MPLSNAIPRRFVVLTTQRTGSSWLMDRINNVPGTQGHMELFYHLPVRALPRAGCNDYPRFVESRHRDGRRPLAVFRYLDELYAREETVGFKLMYSHLREYPEFLYYVLSRNLRVIHLVRNNHLDVVLSEHLANKTGRFHATTADGFEQKETIALDPAVVARLVQRLARKQAAIRGLLKVIPNKVHEVSYESLCHDNRAFLDVCDFLGTPGEREDRDNSHLVKTQRLPHSDVIANYQEVRSALTLAGYQHLLQ